MRVLMLTSQTLAAPPAGSVTYPIGSFVVVPDELAQEWVDARPPIACPDDVEPEAFLAAIAAETAPVTEG